MNSGILLQVLVDVIFLAAFVMTWIRLSKPAKDDPRLSRGLQLLQSKIAILEDLGDQTDRQVLQLNQLIDAKGREIQTKISAADDQIRKIESSLGKSLEVAHIFQDKIPHEEIIDRKATIKYVKAARLAHQGVPMEEIANQVDLSHAELEMVCKVNRNNLQFSEEDLPQWAKGIDDPRSGEVADSGQGASDPRLKLNEIPSAHAGQKNAADKASLSNLGDRFRRALDDQSDDFVGIVSAPTATSVRQTTMPTQAPTLSTTSTFTDRTQTQTPADWATSTSGVKKVIFPKVEDAQKRAMEKKILDRNLG